MNGVSSQKILPTKKITFCFVVTRIQKRPIPSSKIRSQNPLRCCEMLNSPNNPFQFYKYRKRIQKSISSYITQQNFVYMSKKISAFVEALEIHTTGRYLNKKEPINQNDLVYPPKLLAEVVLHEMKFLLGYILDTRRLII